MVRSLRALRSARRLAAAEHGGFMIEVLVSAALLVTAGGGVLMAMDTATSQSGEQRLQAVAADVAQADMERLRSQKFDYLATLNEAPRSVPAAGTVFTVQSTSEWAMQAPAGAVQCTNSARNPEALKITTVVGWPKMRRKPVRLTSLVAAPAGSAGQRGTYVVQITNRDGVGLSGISVHMTGASPVTGSTDENGCVRFTELTPGAYTINFSRAGYLAPSGAVAVSEPTTVVAGQTKSTPFEIDRAGSATVNVRFDSNTSAGSTTLSSPASPPKHLSIDHALAMPSHRAAALPAGGPLLTGNLYPFGGGYQVYADDCANAKPLAPATPLSMVIDPGVFNKQFTLQLPVLEIRPGNSVAGDRVYIKTACGTYLAPVTVSGGSAGGGGKKAEPAAVVSGFPYGTAAQGFSVCAVDVSDNSWDRVTVDNTSYDTPNVVDAADGLDLSHNNTGARCGGWPNP